MEDVEIARSTKLKKLMKLQKVLELMKKNWNFMENIKQKYYQML